MGCEEGLVVYDGIVDVDVLFIHIEDFNLRPPEVSGLFPFFQKKKKNQNVNPCRAMQFYS